MGWRRWSRLKCPVKLESGSEVGEERAAADANSALLLPVQIVIMGSLQQPYLIAFN